MFAKLQFAARRKTKRPARKTAARPRRLLSIAPLALELLEDRRLLSNQQVITVDPSTQSIAPGGSGHIDVIYSTNPPDGNLTGLGLRIHYDSSKIQFASFNNQYDSNEIIGQDTTPQNDSSDFDNNPSTDKYLNTAWVSFTGNFDGTTSPETLYTFNFTTLPGFTSGSTTVDFSASSTASGWSLNAQSATVSAATTNNNPTLDAISNPSAILENTTQPQTINLTGISTGTAGSEPLTVTATSDNTALIPNPTVNYTSPNTTGSISYTPVANQSGTANITVTVSDASGSISRTFQATVTAVNQAPTIDPISDVSVAENAGQQTVNLTGITAGPGDSNQTITVTATSDNPGLIPNPSVTYTSPNTTGSLVFTPVAGQTGTATITVTVQDNGGTANGGVDTTTRTFNVTVLNEAPTLDAINPVNILENAGQQTVNLTGISTGAAGSEPLTVTATSNNTALVPNPTVNYTSPNSTGSISFTPVANASGTATVTVTVSDASGSVTKSFLVTVTAVNQAPTIDAIGDVSVAENAGLQTVNLTGITAGPGDSNQSLTVTATSDNTSLVPNPSVTYSSPNSTGTLTFTPASGQSGTAHITVTVQDNGGTANGGVDTTTRTFTVTVTPANQPPTLNPLGSLTILENAGQQTVGLTGISTGGAGSETLTVTATSNNTALVPNPTVNYTSPNSTGSISFTPSANASGTAIVTVTVSDASGSVSQSLTVTVTPVNQAPTLDAISNVSVAENSGQQSVTLTGITAGPGDTNQSLTVTATSDNTGLIPNPTVSYTSPDNTGTLTFTPVAGQSGTAHITVTVKDNGGTANGGADTTTQTFTVTVTPANQAPTLDAISPITISENAGQQTVSLTGISSGGAGSEALTVTATSNNTALVPNPSVNYTSPNSTGSISFTPVANASGTAIITVTVSDASGSITQAFAVHVTAINQPPTINPIGNISIVENSGPQTVSLTGISAGPGENQTITVTASSDNPSLIPNPTVTYASPSSTGTLTLTPVAGQTGTANITVTVQDNGGTANGGIDTTTRSFQVTVGAVSQGELTARDDRYLLPTNSTVLTVAAPGVLANDSGPAGEALTAELVAAPSHGTLTLNANGSFTYMANATFAGIDSFQYSALANSHVSPTATVTIESHAHSFIRRLYETVLDREPGEAEVQGWLQALAAGFTRAEIVAGFLASPEHLTTEIEAAYHDFLGRAADTSGLAHWLTALENGLSERQFFAGILSSDEYFHHVGGNNEAYVKGLYHDVLGRSTNAADLAAWQAALGTFLSREQAADAFLSTGEFDLLLVNDPHDLFLPVPGWYQHYLNRDAEAAGADHFAAELQAGASYDAVQAAILTSDEFYND